jgi:hypothetical protein
VIALNKINQRIEHLGWILAEATQLLRTKPPVSPLMIPLVDCHIKSFQRAARVEQSWPGGEKALSHITENRKVWTRKSLIFLYTIFGFCPEMAMCDRARKSPTIRGQERRGRVGVMLSFLHGAGLPARSYPITRHEMLPEHTLFLLAECARKHHPDITSSSWVAWTFVHTMHTGSPRSRHEGTWTATTRATTRPRYHPKTRDFFSDFTEFLRTFYRTFMTSRLIPVTLSRNVSLRLYPQG